MLDSVSSTSLRQSLCAQSANRHALAAQQPSRIVQPIKQTLAELFERTLIYVVPSYQRLYVWTLQDQWEPLWLDIAEIANRILTDPTPAHTSANAIDSVEPHFLGAVVLKLSGSTPDLAQQWRVIDGQQRLTTLQLLIAAAVTELEHAGFHDHSDRLRDLTTNFHRSSPNRKRTFKITHQRHRRGHDYEPFPEVMAAALTGNSATPPDGPLSECYQFYKSAIKTWLNEHSGHGDSQAQALATTIVLKIYIVAIYLDPHEKEHIIFETLNARGEPLTEWDKIKNYLLYKADQQPEIAQEIFFEEYLDRFDEPWWRQSVGRGVQRPRTDIFADYWLESTTRTPVAIRRVFREFQRHVDSHEQDLENIMEGFLGDAHYFEQFEKLESLSASREALFHSRRLDLSIGAIWPLLLYLQRLDVERSERDRCFAILESYFVRRMIAGYQARAYDQIALDLLNTIASAHAKGVGIANTIMEHLLQYSEAASIWPNNIEVKEAVLNRHLPRYAQRLILVAIENRLITNRASLTNLASNIQIEHIMPTAWQPESWPLPDSVEPEYAADKRDQAIWTLGNLTLLNGRLNAAISNAAWSRKCAEIQKSDNLFLNRRLLEQSPDEWTEHRIFERGAWMYEEIVKIWPHG